MGSMLEIQEMQSVGASSQRIAIIAQVANLRMRLPKYARARHHGNPLCTCDFDMRHQGRITSWKDDQGFGFITPNGGGDRVFVHIKSFTGRQQRPVESDLVTYELRVDRDRRARAENVAFVAKRATASTATTGIPASGVFTLLFLLSICGLTFAGRLPSAVPMSYMLASIAAFIAYKLDKSAARSGQWRTPERTLHLLGLMGGWPGALLAQKLLRHKSSKRSFQFVFWTTVVLNCGIVGFLLFPAGAEALQTLRFLFASLVKSIGAAG
jgi:uncharacterized membrane protein YsdA (DUF1294 family)/cold shock CspA family protein